MGDVLDEVRTEHRGDGEADIIQQYPKERLPTSEDYFGRLDDWIVPTISWTMKNIKTSRNVVYSWPSLFVRRGRTSKMYWHLSDYLDVLKVLKGKPFVYFSQISRLSLSFVDG